MGLVDLSHIKQLFSSKHPAQTDRELYRELMLMVLARAADADSYTHPAEVEVVQRVLEEHLGDRVESSDIRIAARSKLYETAPIEKYISRVVPKLSRADPSRNRQCLGRGSVGLMTVLRVQKLITSTWWCQLWSSVSPTSLD